MRRPLVEPSSECQCFCLKSFEISMPSKFHSEDFHLANYPHCKYPSTCYYNALNSFSEIFIQDSDNSNLSKIPIFYNSPKICLAYF